MKDILFHLNLIWISLEGAGLIFMLVYKYLKYRLLKEEMVELDDKVSIEEDYTYNINKINSTILAETVATAAPFTPKAGAPKCPNIKT